MRKPCEGGSLRGAASSITITVSRKQTFNGALAETENALVNLNNEQERRNRLQEVVRANQTAFELAQIQ